MSRDIFQECYEIMEAAQICGELPEPLYLSTDEYIEVMQDSRLQYLTYVAAPIRICGVPILRKPLGSLRA